jgi:hypothetical protein
VRFRKCGLPATLDCVAKGGTRHGSYVFRHPLESGKTEVHASATKFPDNLTLVPAPQDRRKKHVPGTLPGHAQG